MQEKDRPYLLTLSSHTDGMDRFLDSLKHAGDSAEKTPTKLNQVFFNDFVYNSGHTVEADPTVFCPLFANIYHGVKKTDGIWFYNDILVSCVHANGSLKELL